MVYSAAKANPLLPLSWARDPEVGLPRPDLVVFLDLAPDEAERRSGFGHEKYEIREMQRNVRRLFRELGESGGEPGSGREGREEMEDLVTVDAGGSVEQVAAKIQAVVMGRLEGLWKDGVLTGEVRRVGKWKGG
jgi:dTMP kinase